MESIHIKPDAPKEPASTVSEADVTVVESGQDGKTILRAEAKSAPQVDPNRPSWLPEKFADAAALKTSAVELAKKLGHGGARVKAYEKLDGQDLADLYTDLEKEQGAAKPQDDPAEKKDDPAEKKDEPAVPPVEEVKNVLDKAGLKFDDFQAEFNKNGDLSEESYKALAEKAGLPKSVVQAWIEGQKAVAARTESEVYAVAGGSKESFAAMAQWAAQNLPKEQIEGFNRIVESKDVNAIKAAAAGLYARYEAAGNGREPSLVGGSRSASDDGVQPFLSTAEVIEAMKDPRYKSGDKSYHQMVEKRLAKSSIM